MTRRHLDEACICALVDYEHNDIDPDRRGVYEDAFGMVQVRPYRVGTYRVTDATGGYLPALGRTVR